MSEAVTKAPPSIENPKPQKPRKHGIDPAIETFWATEEGPQGDKLALVMVGLPGSGKTYITRRLERYLNFFHGTPTKTFDVGEYRRRMFGTQITAEFFDPSNAVGMEQRKQAQISALNDLKDFLVADSLTSRVAIYDATNLTPEHRAWIVKELIPTSIHTKVIFIECIVTNNDLVEENIRKTKLTSPEYRGIDGETALSDYKKKISLHAKLYQPIDPENESIPFIKIKEGGKVFECHKIVGYLPSRIVQFLMNLRYSGTATFYFSRHGQSEYNSQKKVGGDSQLTELGVAYARKLAEFAKEKITKNEQGEPIKTRLWTSSMQRTKETAQFIEHPIVLDSWVQLRLRVWRCLDELHAGICDGMSYEEIAQHYPQEALERKNNKLEYRYPRGESYLDLIARLDPIVHEMERVKEPLLIIGHQAILRVLYCYLMGLPREAAPRTSFPLHTVVKLNLDTYACTEERFQLLEVPDAESPSH